MPLLVRMQTGKSSPVSKGRVSKHGASDRLMHDVQRCFPRITCRNKANARNPVHSGTCALTVPWPLYLRGEEERAREQRACVMFLYVAERRALAAGAKKKATGRKVGGTRFLDLLEPFSDEDLVAGIKRKCCDSAAPAVPSGAPVTTQQAHRTHFCGVV